MLSSWENNMSHGRTDYSCWWFRDLMHHITHNKLIKFSSIYVAVAQFTAYNTLNSFNKLKKFR